MGACFRCDRDEKEVKLVDAIYENEMVKVCEKCSITESIPILRKPTTSQLKEAERSQGVSQRLRRISGMMEQEERRGGVLDQIRRLEENPELEKPEEKRPFNLIDNFHWHIQRERRNKGLSPRQLGWALGESEAAIKIIEKGELPEDAEKFIRKLEQFFQIKLRERTEKELEEEKRREREKKEFKFPAFEKEPEFDEIEPIEPIISEPEIDELDIVGGEQTEDTGIDENAEPEKAPAKILSFKPEVMDDLTIADLKTMREEKEKEEEQLIVMKKEAENQKAESFIKEAGDVERRKQELRKEIGEEMKDIALGREKPETIGGKREMLDKAMEKMSWREEKKEKIPKIHELMEKKKQSEQAGSIEEKSEIKPVDEMTEEKPRQRIWEKTEENLVEEQSEEDLTEQKTEESLGEESEVPSISDLIEKKKQRGGESILGDDIELVEGKEGEDKF